MVWQGEEKMACEEKRNGFENLSTSFRLEAAELTNLPRDPLCLEISGAVWLYFIPGLPGKHALVARGAQANFVRADSPAAFPCWLPCVR